MAIAPWIPQPPSTTMIAESKDLLRLARRSDSLADADRQQADAKVTAIAAQRDYEARQYLIDAQRRKLEADLAHAVQQVHVAKQYLYKISDDQFRQGNIDYATGFAAQTYLEQWQAEVGRLQGHLNDLVS